MEFHAGKFLRNKCSGIGDTESVFRTSSITSHGWLSGGKFGIEGSIFTTIVLSAGIITVILIIRKKCEKKEL